MADEIIPDDSDETTDTQFIRTTDAARGDPPGTTGTLTGPINVALQKVMNTLLYLKNRLDNLNLTVNNASSTQRGIVELATPDEVETGTDTQRATTPEGVAQAIAAGTSAAPNASTTVRGIAELATLAESRTGTDTVRTVTPAGARAAIDNRVPTASESTEGKVELASNAEAGNNANNSRVMTPQRTHQQIDAKIVQRTQAQYDAITNPDSNKTLCDRRLNYVYPYCGWS